GPTVGLEPRSRHLVFETIAWLRDEGRTVLLVEQNARAGLAAADHGAVLDGGRVALAGPGTALLTDPRTAELYLGGGASAASTPRPWSRGPAATAAPANAGNARTIVATRTPAASAIAPSTRLAIGRTPRKAIVQSAMIRPRSCSRTESCSRAVAVAFET